jgi:hypothetical protein
MPERRLDPSNLAAMDEDWLGNNAAFTCPLCRKVFIVTNAPKIHDPQEERPCPHCGGSVGHCTGGAKSGGAAYITW